MNNKILCIGDSSALPGHTNRYEDTWFFRLKQEYPEYDFISVFRRAITTDILVSEGSDPAYNFPGGSDCLEFYKPEMVILQLGIVDCAPRLVRRKSIEGYLVGRLPGPLREKYLKTKEKYIGRQDKNVFVDLKQFTKNLDTYVSRCKLSEISKLIFIGICYPDKRMTDKNPKILANIEKYNSEILRLSSLYDFIKVIFPLDSRKYESIYEDGYHPNVFGNKLIFNDLIKVL